MNEPEKKNKTKKKLEKAGILSMNGIKGGGRER
jgi:hypothetical protein